jgi:hypothetical protein
MFDPDAYFAANAIIEKSEPTPFDPDKFFEQNAVAEVSEPIPKPELPTGLSRIGASAKAGLIGLGSTAAQGVKAMAENAPTIRKVASMFPATGIPLAAAATVLETQKQPIQEATTAIDKAYAEQKAKVPSPELWKEGEKFSAKKALDTLKNPDYWTGNVPETLVQQIPAFLVGGGAAGKLGGKAAASLAGAIGGAQEGASQYKKLRDEGLSPEEAAVRAGAFGAGTAILNKLPFDRIFGSAAKGVADRVKKMFLTGITEGITEGAEEPLSALTDYLGREGYDANAVMDELMKSLPRALNVAPLATITGAAGGAVNVQGRTPPPLPQDSSLAGAVMGGGAQVLTTKPATEQGTRPPVQPVPPIQAPTMSQKATQSVPEPVSAPTQPAQEPVSEQLAIGETAPKTPDQVAGAQIQPPAEMEVQNAQGIREDQGVNQPVPPRDVVQGGEGVRGEGLQRPAPFQPEPVAEGEGGKKSELMTPEVEQFNENGRTQIGQAEVTLQRWGKSREVHMTELRAYSPNAGMELLGKLTAWADQNGLRLIGEARPMRTEPGVRAMPQDKLIRFYQRFGFKKYGTDNIARESKEKPSTAAVPSPAPAPQGAAGGTVEPAASTPGQKAPVSQAAPPSTPVQPIPTPPPLPQRGPIGIKHASTAELRKELNIPSYERTGSRSDQQLQEEVGAAFAANPNIGRDTLEFFSTNPDAVPNPLQSVIMQRELVTAARDFDNAPNEVTKEASYQRVKSIMDITDRGGSEAGAALRARRFIMDGMFSLAIMEYDMQKTKGAPLTQEEKDSLAAIKQKFDAQQEKVTATETEIRTENADLQALASTAKANLEFKALVDAVMANPAKHKRITDSMRTWADEHEAAVLARMKARSSKMSAGVDPTVIADLVELGTVYIVRGTANMTDWIATMRTHAGDMSDDDLGKIYGQSQQKYVTLLGDKLAADKEPTTKSKNPLKQKFRAQAQAGVKDFETALENVWKIEQTTQPDITKEQVRDQFSEYGQATKTSRTDIDRIVADFRRQAQLLASIERVKKELAPLKSGPQRDKPSPRVRELTRQLNKLMKDAGISTTDSESQIAGALDGIKTRLKNAIEDLNKALTTKTAITKDVKSTEYDDEAKALKAERDKLQEQYDEMFPEEKVESTPQTRLANAKTALKKRMDKVRGEITEKERTPKKDRSYQVDQELSRMREEEAMLKNLRDKYLPAEEPQYVDEKQASRIEEQLTKEITDLEEQIQTGVKRQKAEPKTITNEAIEKLRREKERRQAIFDEMFPTPPLTPEERLENAIRSSEKSLAYWEQRLKDGQDGKFLIEKPTPEPMPFSEKLNEIKTKRDAAKAEFNRLKGLSVDVRVANKKRGIERSIARMHKMMQSGNYTAKPKTEDDILTDPRLVKELAELEKVRNEFAYKKEEARRSQRTSWEAVKENGLEIYDATRDLISTYDWSAIGRQGWYFLLSHPYVAMKNVAKMFKATTRTGSTQDIAELKNRENYKNGVYQRAGVAFAKDDGTGNYSQIEDRFKLRLLKKWPGIEMSARWYASLLNNVRADFFDMLLANTKNPKDTNTAKIKALASGVNILTGRGELSKKINAETAAHFVFAPRFLQSAFDVLTGKPLRKGTTETKLLFAKEYLRAAGTMAGIYLIASMFLDDDDKIDWDTRSSAFGAIPIPGTNQKINPLGYVRTMLVFLARLFTGVEKSGEKYSKLRKFGTIAPGTAKERVPFGRGFEQTVWNFLQTKAHPGIGAAMTAGGMRDSGGKDIDTWKEAGKAIGSLAVPLSVRQAYQLIMMEDPGAAATLSLLSTLGVDVSPDYQSEAYKEYADKGEEKPYKPKKLPFAK